MERDFPVDPRLKDVDQAIVETIFKEFKQNIDLVAIHLRDARNLLYGVRDDTRDRALCKATLLLAAAALESNLVYLSGAALSIAERKKDVLAPGQIRYLKGIEEVISDNGDVVVVPAKQSLLERLQIGRAHV